MTQSSDKAETWKRQPSYTLAELAQTLELEYQGDANTVVTALADLSQAKPGQLSFLANPRYQSKLAQTQASVVIIKVDAVDLCPCACLISDNPYLSYAQVSHLFDPLPRPLPGIHTSAVVDSSAQIAATASIGAKAVIEAGVQIGEGVIIGAGCFIGAGAKIGATSRLHANVSIYHQVELGEQCLVQAGAVIGSDGFGYAPNKGAWQKIAQIGTVIIGDRVEIGANTCIDRGAIGNTVIADDVIIDNQVHMAHNVSIGEGTAIAGCTGIAGSTSIGKHCTVAGAVAIAGHLNITDNVHLSGMSMVTGSIKEPGSYSSGTGLQESRLWRKNAVRFSQLDSFFKAHKARKTD